MNPHILENNTLRVEISTTGFLNVIEKASGTHWKPDPWMDCPGELYLKDRETGKNIRCYLHQSNKISFDQVAVNRLTIQYDRMIDESGQTHPEVRLNIILTLVDNSPELSIIVDSVSYDPARYGFESLVYPLRFGSLLTDKDKGYLAVPFNQGALVPSGRFKIPLRDEWHQWDDLSWQVSGLAWGTEGASGDLNMYGWNALSMPWFGAVKDGSAFVAVLETENDAKLNFILNYNLQDDFNRTGSRSPYTRLAVLSPRWMSTRGEFGYSRRMVYRFFSRGTHVDMANFYRGIAERQGLLVTLREKLSHNPEVEKLFGAPMIQVDGGYPWYTDYKSMMYTWKDLRRVADDLYNNLGVNRAFICTWGGYSKLPPESYPFHPEWGTEDDLRETVRYLLDLGYLYTTYHGYPANLPHAGSFTPDEARMSPSGEIGGRWGGRCSASFLKYARQDLPRAAAVTGQTADYTDMVTASGLIECYHPNHPLTRSQDREHRLELLRYIRSLGLLTGSEVVQAYAMPEMDYCKGGMIVGLRYFLLQHIHAPLFNLVFHDCLVTYDGTVGTSRRKEYSNETLECLAYGVQPMFSFNFPHYPGVREVIRQTHALYSNFQKKVAMEPLVHHEYLGDGFDVQHTRFASGDSVYINTDTAPYNTGNGMEIPARGFVIEKSTGGVNTGAIQTRFGPLSD